MSVPSWDSRLPQKMKMAGLGGSEPDNVLRSTMDVGPDKTRPRGSAQPEPIQGYQIMTKTQFGYFQSFYRTTLAQGSLRFSWTHPVTGASCEMKFRESPSWSIESGWVKVDYKLEVLP